MRKLLIYMLLLIITISCSDDDKETNQGCLTAIPKTGPQDRILIRCSTREQYLAGSNTSQGGTGSWDLYTGHKWEKCGDCK